MLFMICKKKKILLFLALLPYLIWLSMSLTIMKDYIQLWHIIIVSVVLLSLSISVTFSSFIAHIITIISMTIVVSYLVYEGSNNVYFGVLYPIFICLFILYYGMIAYVSHKIDKNCESRKI